ncbi:MAG: CoA-transferase [Myxococcota bacterium]
MNSGIGIPTLVANHLPADGSVALPGERPSPRHGPALAEGDEDPQIINAGKQTVTIVPGGSTFDSTLSFAMIRGGHVDLAILGAMQVVQNGDIANLPCRASRLAWAAPWTSSRRAG